MSKAVKDQNQTQDQGQNHSEELEMLREQLRQKDEDYKRALADYRNLQQQSQQERARLIQMATAGVLEELLPILDNLELVQQHFPDPSLQMVLEELKRVLRSHGLEPLSLVPGDAFDHETMEAVDTAPGEESTVLEQRRQGYRLNGNVLRHAQVIVGNGK